jgi:hypothetical protein
LLDERITGRSALKLNSLKLKYGKKENKKDKKE